MTLEAGIALARALVDACPKTMPASVKKAAKKLSDAADKARDGLAARQKALGKISDEDVRLIDQAGDSSWGALRTRLLGYSTLPGTEYPDAMRAGELVIQLFGEDGLSFLKETYPVQWSTADTILHRIDSDGLREDIDRIAGKEFLDNVRKRHAAYGAMVKRLMIKESAAAVNLSDEVRALGRAIVAYATQVCAHADDDAPDTIEQARAAVRPLDMFREASAKRSSSDTSTQAPPAPQADV
jgi:hypothetical protein